MTQTAAPAAPAPPRKMTYEEYLEWETEYNATEWVDGEIIYLTTSIEHNDLSGFLFALLLHFVQHFNLGKVQTDPFNMKTGPNLPGRAPDVFFIANENVHRIQKNHLQGPADLVVEVVSPDSIARDYEDKYREYEQGGVREYWIVDPLVTQARFLVRGEDGKFQDVFPDADGIYRSTVLPGLWLDVNWLWQEPLPRLTAILKAWELV